MLEREIGRQLQISYLRDLLTIAQIWKQIKSSSIKKMGCVCVCVCVYEKWESESVSCSVVSHFCYSMDCSPPGSCLWNSPGKNTGVGCHSLSRGSS